MEILIKAAQLIASLSILVIFHELGHFTFAKLFKTRVEKFYLFFDPWFSLFKFKKGDTEYGIGWLPLGGYVKISGMIDESMDKEQLKLPPQEWEFRSKPAWQRLLIMIGGVMVNFLLAIVIYVMILFYWGEEQLPLQNASYGVVCDSTAMNIGFQNGDKIIAVGEKEVNSFENVLPTILLEDVDNIQVERNGEIHIIELNDQIIAQIISNKSRLVEPAFPFYVNSFSENSPAEKAGLLPNDLLLGINRDELKYFVEYPPVLQKYANQEIELMVLRNHDTLFINTTVTQDGKLGIYPKSPKELFTWNKVEYNFLEAIPAGVSRGYEEVGDYLKQFKLLFTPETEAYKSLGGFMSIGDIFPKAFDWRIFWSLTALLSIMLGVVNILPIPALDGGHVLFLFYEIISGRKPSDKFLEYTQIVGMVILFALLIYANGNDIVKYFFD